MKDDTLFENQFDIKINTPFNHPLASFEKQVYNYWFENGVIEIPIECKAEVILEIEELKEYSRNRDKVNLKIILNVIQAGFNLSEMNLHVTGRPTEDYCFKLNVKNQNEIIISSLVFLRKSL